MGVKDIRGGCKPFAPGKGRPISTRRVKPELAEGATKGLRTNFGKVARGRVKRIGKAAGVMSTDCTKSGECAKKCS